MQVGAGNLEQMLYSLERETDSLVRSSWRQAPPENEVAALQTRVEVLISQVLVDAHILGHDADAYKERLQTLVVRIAPFAPTHVKEEDVRSTFTRIMLDHAFSPESQALDLKSEASKVQLTARTLLTALIESKHLPDAILLDNGVALTHALCPDSYKPLHGPLLALKAKVATLSADQLKQLGQSLLAPQGAPLAAKILEIASIVSKREVFEMIFTNLQEASGVIVASHAPTPESLAGVNEELIRRTFYKTMIEHAKIHKLIPPSAYEGQESYIYVALTAHTILEVLLTSQHLEGAIQLFDKKALTLTNCPKVFEELARRVLELKKKIPFLTPEQVLMIKYSSIDDETVKVPEVALQMKTVEMMQLATIINDASTQISQIPNFNNMIGHIVRTLTQPEKGGS